MKATIVGAGPSWKESPFSPGELWGPEICLIKDGLKDKPFTKIFNIDNNEIAHKCLAIAKERNIPFISLHEYATELYPLKDVVKRFQVSYFKNTISYMLAYALFKGYDMIRLDGVDQGPQWEYQQGKSYVTFWLGVATGLGVDWRMGQGSLTWTYRIGQDSLPEAFQEKEGLIRE